LTGNIIGAAIDVHRALGSGLLESAYEACFIYELRLRQLKVEAQKTLPILRLYGTCARGLLINFNVKLLVEGIRRMKIYPLSMFSVGSVVVLAAEVCQQSL